jgi:hypothetical protein
MVQPDDEEVVAGGPVWAALAVLHCLRQDTFRLRLPAVGLLQMRTRMSLQSTSSACGRPTC